MMRRENALLGWASWNNIQSGKQALPCCFMYQETWCNLMMTVVTFFVHRSWHLRYWPQVKKSRRDGKARWHEFCWALNGNLAGHIWAIQSIVLVAATSLLCYCLNFVCAGWLLHHVWKTHTWIRILLLMMFTTGGNANQVSVMHFVLSKHVQFPNYASVYLFAKILPCHYNIDVIKNISVGIFIGGLKQS
jgi:hypothetical protein